MDEANEEGEWSDDMMDPMASTNADNSAALNIQRREIGQGEERLEREGMFPTS